MAHDASSYRGVTVSEQFPYPGKRKLQGAIAGKDVEAAQANYEAIRRRITAEVKTAFYEYFYDDKALRTANRNKATLEELAQNRRCPVSRWQGHATRCAARPGRGFAAAGKDYRA